MLILDADIADVYFQFASDLHPADRFPASRPSISAEASRVAELSRIRSMSVEERMRLALSLHQRLRDFKPQKIVR
ncbi:MAG: hypothetical protein JJU05_00175 [Verrucomicrobia bacterium]|nr:hypothetical protein [Verrucomicrobiota bacterium]MCH8526243.1 hypothetical protein [Kiritimatiellia bacterium]